MAGGTYAGSKHLPLGQLSERLNDLDPNLETIVICRSGLVCELLIASGYNVISMTGGLNNWKDELVCD